jgi:long-chain acyl-CoA synthetase
MSCTSWCFKSKAIPDDFQYTTEVQNIPQVEGEGRPRRYYQDTGELASVPDGILDLHQNFTQAVQKAGSKPFLGHRPITNGVAGPFVWQTYDEVALRVKNLGAGLVYLSMRPDSMIGFFSNNIPQWVIAEHACYMQGMITVPLYDTLGHEAVEYIVVHF